RVVRCTRWRDSRHRTVGPGRGIASSRYVEVAHLYMQISAPFATGAARARTAMSEAHVTIDPRPRWREIALSGVPKAGAAASWPMASVRRRPQILARLRPLRPARPAMAGSALLRSIAGSTQL